MSIVNKSLGLLIIMCLVKFMTAQPVDSSPYSSFGIGNIADDNLVFYQGMGGVSAAFLDGYHLNLKNPASYAFLNNTAFETGISGKYTNITDGSQSANIWQGNLDYFALGFPLRNPINASLDRVQKNYSLGMSFFLKPHSTVGYNISSNFENENFGSYTKNFQGSGGTNKFMWGNSIRYKNFGFGANLGYLFGNIIFNENIFFDGFDFAFENRYGVDYNVNGFVWDAGFVYNWFINKSAFQNNKALPVKMLNFGIYGNSAQSFNTTSDRIERVVFEEGNIADTLSFENDVSGSGRLPAEFGIGVNYTFGSKYGIGVNFEYGAWSNYKNSVREETLSDTYRLSIGGHIRPDAKAFNNYFKRVAYKFGLFYEQNPQIIENNVVTDIGMNLGANFPFYYQRKISHVNAAFQFGIKGAGTVIRESYIRLALGFTFNDDEWFIQRKYN